MKSNRIRIIGIMVIAVLLLAAAFFMLYESGLLKADPRVEVYPDNNYDETLTVITDADYRPYSFYAEDGSFSGHDVELITLVANELHMNLELRLMNWSEAIAAVVAGNADVLMTCDYSDSFEGVEQLIKSETVSSEEFIVYARESIPSVDALYGKRIAVMKDGNVLGEMSKKNLTPWCVEYPDNRKAMQALIDGEADCIAVRLTVGTVLLKELGSHGIRGYVSVGESDMCFGINASKPELADRINTALEILKIRGETEKLREKWLTTFIRPYTMSEVLARNPWMIFVFVLLSVFTVAALYIYNSRRMQTKEKEYRNAQVIEQLSRDFECVNYIDCTSPDGNDRVENYRISYTLRQLIPGWEKEKSFGNKLVMLQNTLVYEPDREHFREEATREKAIEAFKKNDVYFVNVRLAFDDGIRYYQLKFIPVYDGQTLKGIVAGLHSVDEQTRKEMALLEQLQTALNAADAASKSKTEFLFNMSHDIRTPMNAILGYTNMGLRHAEDVEKSRNCYQKIMIAGKHLLDLINDILEMSRIESGKLVLAMNPTDLRRNIEGVDLMCKALAFPKGIDYRTEVGEINHPWVLTDELHLNEIIINLVSNAIKYTPEGGRVRYQISETACPGDGTVSFRFLISDNGIGMSEEFQKHLFETFAREENASVSRTEGAGLGLSIVRRIVDQAGGTVSVSSKPGEGSVFTVDLTFPLSNEKSVEDFRKKNGAEIAEISEEKDLTGKRLLLVEDNEMNREIATEILEEAGFAVETAEDGSVAVDTVREKGTDYYDCILMDIRMPNMNGYEATRRIREFRGGSAVPIIALSANAFDEDRQKSLEAGMNGHIAKPIDIRLLLEILHNLCTERG